MSKIFITGHRNPDLDSLCSASAYAILKNTIDPDNEYVPVHCSPVSNTVHKQMKELRLPIPSYKKDVHPRVGDVMRHTHKYVQSDSPIYALVQSFKNHTESVLPLYDGQKFRTLLSIDDMTSWFLRENIAEESIYRFPVENVAQTIPGTLIQPGESDVIEGYMLVGAASKEAFAEFVNSDDRCIVFMGNRSPIISHAIESQVPAIIITTIDGELDYDFSGYKGLVYTTPLGTAEALHRMRLVEPLISMVRSKPKQFQSKELFDDAKVDFSKTELRGMAVMDGDEYVGFVTRRCFLDKPSESIIMVDHNEAGQSINGIEGATILEIIDHHRLDALSTKLPIYIAAEPLGSTCTIVLQQFRKYGIEPSELAARYMLTGLLSDTLILKSPTTTATDVSAAEDLAKIAGIDDVVAYGRKIFNSVESLATQDPLEKAQGDFKEYESGGIHMGIGQCEVTTLSDLGEYSENYLAALEEIKRAHNLDWVMLMITNVLKEDSVLLVSDSKMNSDLPYKQIRKHIYSMPGVMSRKKQLLPTILSITG